MLKKIFFRLADGETEFDRLKWVIPFLLVFFGEMAVGLFAGVFLTFWIGEMMGVDADPIADRLLFFYMFWLPFIDLFWDSFKLIFSKIKIHRREKNRERKGFLSAAGTYLSGIRSDTEQWFVSTFGITPHLERYIELPERIRVISEKKFRPYRHNVYGRVSYIKVSEDDKWVKILGKYFPLDLICGYNNETNELFFIDGYVVKLPPKAMTDRFNKCIEDFFDERGYTYDNLPSGSRERFDKLVGDRLGQFETIDWSGLRHDWEMATSDAIEERNVKKSVADRYKPVLRSGKLNRDYLKRALSPKEIQLTAEVFRDSRFSISVSEVTDFSAYINEYSVCNGVYILRELKYPANKKGLDFLFECLKDVDEAYFMPAAQVLSEVPVEVLAPVIEKKAEEAYLRCDVSRLAGIMYLAKEIDYDIKFVDDLKKRLNVDVSTPTTEVDENGVVRFALSRQN
jgi:hypothetical protein